MKTVVRFILGFLLGASLALYLSSCASCPSKFKTISGVLDCNEKNVCVVEYDDGTRGLQRLAAPGRMVEVCEY